MPANKYGKSLYKAGTMKSEKAAIANRDPARKKAAEKIMAREGTTSTAGGRPAVKMLPKIAPAEKRTLPANPNKPAQKQTLPAKANQPVEKRILPYKPAKPAKPVQVIRTTQLYKPTPSSKKR
jgi:hypothetical protein